MLFSFNDSVHKQTTDKKKIVSRNKKENDYTGEKTLRETDKQWSTMTEKKRMVLDKAVKLHMLYKSEHPDHLNAIDIVEGKHYGGVVQHSFKVKNDISAT